MSFARSFILLTYGVAGLGFLALVLSQQVGPVGILVMAIALGFSHERFRPYFPSAAIWRVLTPLFLLYSSLSVLVFGASLLRTGASLLIYLQANRLFVRSRNRDYTYIYLFSFLQILLSTILSISPLLALVLVTFMVAASWALMLLQVKIGIDEQYAVAAGIPYESQQPDTPLVYQPARQLLSPSFLFASAAVSLVMLTTTIVMFLFIPRLELSLFQRGSTNSVHVAGLSEEVRLGEVGRILKSRARVMRVKLEGPGLENLGTPYWRGLALDHFDGQSWRMSATYRDIYHTRSPVLNMGGPPRGTNLVQRYILEALDSQVIFAMPRVLAIQCNVPTLWRNYTDSFRTSDIRGRLDYIVYSDASQPSPETLRKEENRIPPRIAEIYLQLPELSPEVKVLAEQVSAGQPTLYDQVLALEAFLRTNYHYTTEPKNQGPAPIEDFLFNTKEGHCEYFSSALVVLCRSIGIPARVVNGFAGGEYNPVGGHWVVRQEDAHSWAEVRFPEHGWIRFDATPAASGQTGQGRTVWNTMRQYADYLEMQWYFYVLDYDTGAQLELLSGMFSGTHGLTLGPPPLRNTVSQSSRWIKRGGVVVLGGAAVVMALFLLARQWGRSSPAERQAPDPLARKFLRRRKTLHRELERRGFQRRAGETSLERAERAGRALDVGPLLRQVEMDFYATRYGEIRLSDEMLALAQQALETVRGLPRP